MPYVYVMKCNEFYKIGFSNNIEKRIKTLMVGNPYELEIIFVFEHNDAKEIEFFLHSRYKKENIRGEWFALSLEQIQEIENICLSFSSGKKKEERQKILFEKLIKLMNDWHSPKPFIQDGFLIVAYPVKGFKIGIIDTPKGHVFTINGNPVINI
jgi:hypothetical protein